MRLKDECLILGARQSVKDSIFRLKSSPVVNINQFKYLYSELSVLNEILKSFRLIYTYKAKGVVNHD